MNDNEKEQLKEKESNLLEEIKLSEQAHEILNNPVLHHVLIKAKDAVMQDMLSSHDDFDALRKHKYMFSAVEHVLLEVKRFYKRGEVAREQLKKLREKLEEKEKPYASN